MGAPSSLAGAGDDTTASNSAASNAVRGFLAMVYSPSYSRISWASGAPHSCPSHALDALSPPRVGNRGQPLSFLPARAARASFGGPTVEEPRPGDGRDLALMRMGEGGTMQRLGNDRPGELEHVKLVDTISSAYNVLLAVVWAVPFRPLSPSGTPS